MVVILGLTSLVVNAQAISQNDCTNIFNVADWLQLSGQVINCLNSDSKFTSGISILCQADKSNLSIQYSRYLDYEKKYQAAAAVIESMPEPTAEAQNDLDQAEQNWELLGHKVLNEAMLYEVRWRYGFCISNYSARIQ